MPVERPVDAVPHRMSTVSARHLGNAYPVPLHGCAGSGVSVDRADGHMTLQGASTIMAAVFPVPPESCAQALYPT